MTQNQDPQLVLYTIKLKKKNQKKQQTKRLWQLKRYAE